MWKFILLAPLAILALAILGAGGVLAIKWTLSASFFQIVGVFFGIWVSLGVVWLLIFANE